MASGSQANNGLDHELLQELVETHETIANLESKLKVMKEKIKGQMKAQGLTVVQSNGKSVTLTYSQRETPAKDIVSRLAAMGLTQCLKTELKADVDRLKIEVGGLAVSKEVYDSLIKTSEVCTMNIK